MRFRNENTALPQIPAEKCFRFTANQLSTVSFNNSAPQLQYKINDGEWIDYNTASVSITLQLGDVMKWKRKVSTVRTAQLGQFHITGSVSVSGNIMSLLDGENYQTMTDLTGWGGGTDSTGIFYSLLSGNNITDASGLILPAMILAPYCYKDLFANCQSLVSAPALPATTLTTGCYFGMFWNCISLVNPPDLLATTLVSDCYNNLFTQCSSLQYIKCMATSGINTSNSTNYWTNLVNATGTFVKAPGVSSWPTSRNGIPVGWTVVEYEDFTGLTFTAGQPSTISFSKGDRNLQYKINNGSWTNYDTANQSISLQNNDKIFWKRSTNTVISESIGTFSMTGTLAASGNIMSILDGTNYSTMTSLSGWTSIFKNLFLNCSSLTSAPALPAVTLSANCYLYMFRGCTGLTSAPALSAVTMAADCYYGMFRGCSMMTSAPALPATTLANECYGAMFWDCSSLTSAPALNVTTLTTGCYTSMFYGCTSLTTAPSLPATTMTPYCYDSMFNGCSSLTSAPSLPATTLANNCYYGMFWECSSLTTAPALPATTLANHCYGYMFASTALTTIPALPATTLANYCYSNMFGGCQELTNVSSSALPATNLANNCYDGMFYNCNSLLSAPDLPATYMYYKCYADMFANCGLTTAPDLPATDLDESCYNGMFANCDLTTAPALPATTLANECYSGMFIDCTSLTSAPDLEATALVDGCYYRMFDGCTQLNYIKCLASDGFAANQCLDLWTNNVSQSGNFVKAAGVEEWPAGVNGIPEGWFVTEE